MVTVYEREDKVGRYCLRYGIPNMKLEKQYHRPEDHMLWSEEGITFVTGLQCGKGQKSCYTY